MGGWDELRETGAFGDEATMLLYRCVRAVARFGGYPPPEDSPRWDLDAIEATAHAVFASGRGPARLVELASRATTEADFARLLEAVVRNHLRDQARRTSKGRLMRRLDDLLDVDDRFTRVGAGTEGAGNVTLSDGSLSGVFGGRHEDLVAAAYGTSGVRLLRWREDARRQPPIADRDSLLRVCEAVLRAAGASMRLSALADVVADRFALGASPVTAGRDTEPWPAELDNAGPSAPADEQAIVDAAAAAIVAQMTPSERLVLANLDQTVREMADRTGMSKSTAALAATNLRIRLAGLLIDDEHAEQILRQAMALARGS